MLKSKMKTPLARLRVTLGLGQKEIASWLDCSVFNVQSVETGRVRLTEENAWLVANETAVSPWWLLGNGKTEPTDWHGQHYSKATFQKRQVELARQKTDHKSTVAMATRGLAACASKLAAVLALAAQQGKTRLAETKIMAALDETFSRLDKTGIDRTGLVSSFMRGKHTVSRPDFGPLLHAWENEAKKRLKLRK